MTHTQTRSIKLRVGHVDFEYWAFGGLVNERNLKTGEVRHHAPAHMMSRVRNLHAQVKKASNKSQYGTLLSQHYGEADALFRQLLDLVEIVKAAARYGHPTDPRAISDWRSRLPTSVSLARRKA